MPAQATRQLPAVPDNAPSLNDIVLATARVLGAMRQSFESRNYLEVVTPVLEDVHHSPFFEPLEVELGEGRLTRRAQLSVGPAGYLEPLLPQMGGVYAIAPAFRGNRGPDWLLEFRYVQVVAQGGLNDAMELAEAILRAAVSEVGGRGVRLGDHTQNLEPVRVSYREALETVRAEPNTAFTQSQYLELTAAHGNRPVFMVGVPLSIEPSAAMCSRQTDEGLAFFELVLPFAGEVGSGKEYEPNISAVRQQLAPAPEIVAQAAANWHSPLQWFPPEEVQTTVEMLAQMPQPTFTLTMGLERFTQYILGADRITRAAAYPITTDARTLGLVREGLRAARIMTA